MTKIGKKDLTTIAAIIGAMASILGNLKALISVDPLFGWVALAFVVAALFWYLAQGQRSGWIIGLLAVLALVSVGAAWWVGPVTVEIVIYIDENRNGIREAFEPKGPVGMEVQLLDSQGVIRIAYTNDEGIAIFHGVPQGPFGILKVGPGVGDVASRVMGPVPVPISPTPLPRVTPTDTTPPKPPTLTLTPTPMLVVIMTFHGRYVTPMGPDQGWVLRAETMELKKDEGEFTLLCLDDGKVALKTYHGRYVTATRGEPWLLKTETSVLGNSEKFTLVKPETKKELRCPELFRLLEEGDVLIALKTCYDRYVTAMNDQPGWDWELRAETTALQDWEKFTLVPLR